MGLRRRDIGPVLTWRDLRAYALWAGPETALYRAQHPRSWSWSIDTDLLAAILYSTQAGNWQRGGGKGDKPRPILRPDDSQKRASLDTSVPVEKRKNAMTDELARRRAKRARQGRSAKSVKRKVVA
jgi:hypothetical protein